MRTVFNENQIVEPAGKQGPPCCSQPRPGSLLHWAQRGGNLSSLRGSLFPCLTSQKVAVDSGPAQACHPLACIFLRAGQGHLLLRE